MPSQDSTDFLGLIGIIVIVLAVLKLTGKIAWSWLWVTAALWGSIAIVFALIIIIGGLLFLTDLIIDVWRGR
jgi:hypothetical protein